MNLYPPISPTGPYSLKPFPIGMTAVRPVATSVGTPINPFGKTSMSFGPLTPQLNFFNPITGRRGPSVTPNPILPPNPFNTVVTNFNSNDINVNISGTKQCVDKAVALLKGSTAGSTAGSGAWHFDASGLLVSPNPATKFSGSGVMLFECKYVHQIPYGPSGCKPTVLLVGTNAVNASNVNTILYEDMGGNIYRPKYLPIGTLLQLNAKNNVYEESNALFKIEKDLEKDVNGRQLFMDVLDNNTNALYRTYFMFLKGTESRGLREMYALNKSKMKIDVSNPDHIYWDETVDMRRFLLEDIYKAIDAGRITCPDVDGNVCEIRDRTLNCFKELKKHKDLVITAYNNIVNVPNPVQDGNGVQTFNII